MRRWNPVGRFGAPLVFFPEAPENEDAGEKNGEHEGKPSPLGYFGQRGRQVQTVERAEDEESNCHDHDRQPPDDHRDEGDHERCDERHQDHADPIRLAQLGCLERSKMLG